MTKDDFGTNVAQEDAALKNKIAKLHGDKRRKQEEEEEEDEWWWRRGGGKA